MHNLYCNSFREACRLLGEDKEKRLKKFSKIVGDKNDELFYIDAYGNLFKHVMQIISERIDAHKVMITSKLDILKEHIDHATHFSEKYFQLLEIIEKFIKDDKMIDEQNPDCPEYQKLVLYKNFNLMFRSKLEYEVAMNSFSVKDREYISFLKDHSQFIWRFFSSSKVLLDRNSPSKKTEE